MLAQKSGALGGSEADLKNLEEQFRMLDPKGTGRIDVADFTKAPRAPFSSSVFQSLRV